MYYSLLHVAGGRVYNLGFSFGDGRVPFPPWILQSHTLHPTALFVSLITKCNRPCKYTKNPL